MNRSPVVSSNLASVGYDPITATLEIEFRSSGVYRYFDVPAAIHDGLMAASAQGASVGQYFDRNVKKAGFRFSKA
jgi:hypothetical protein